MATKPSVVSTTASKYKGKSIQTLSDGTKVRVNTGTNKSGSGSKNAINTASTSSLASERFDLDTPLAAPQAPTAPVSTPPVPYSQQTPPPLANANYSVATGGVNYQFDQSGNLVGSGAATYKTPPIPNVESLRTPVTSADALTSFIMEMDKSNKAAQREYLKSLEPTKNENKLQERIDNILSSSEQGLLNAEGRVVPMQAIIGEQQLIEKRTQTLLAPLQRELERAVSARESKTKALGTALDFREKNQNLQFQILKEIQAPILEAQKETRSFARTLLTKYPDIAPYIDINSMSAEDIAGMVSSRSKIFQLEQSDAGLDLRLKQAQIAETYSKITASAGDSKETEVLARVNDINNVLAEPGLDSAFGATGIIAARIPGSQAQVARAKVQQVIDTAALAARGQLKGQGQISDFEGQMLKQAQTALRTTISPEAARKELKKIRGAILTSSGQSAVIKVTDPKTGQSKTAAANQAMINDAIRQGYRVEYE